MYEEWRRDPESVHASWRSYFHNIENGADVPYQAAPTLGQTGSVSNIDDIVNALQARGISGGGSATAIGSADSKKI
jgi:2-oxoglutarate dehydrogenase complex dehydrogenase (E1) component-like enzyme